MTRRALGTILAVMLLAGAAIQAGVGLSRAQDNPTPTPNINWVREPQGVNVRSGPGRNYDVLGALPLSAWVQPLARDASGEWILITYLYTQGWVQVDGVVWRLNTAALPVLEDPAPTPIPAVRDYNTPGGPTYTPNANWVSVGAMGAYVRSGPGQGYLALGELYTGDVVDPVAQDAAEDWVLIRFGNGYGWIRYDLVIWIEDIAALPIIDLPELTPSFTAVPVNPTATSTLTATATPTITASFTATVTATATNTSTATPTVTASTTATATLTPSTTPTFTETPTATLTVTPSDTPAPTATLTATSTAVPAPTETAVPTATVTPTLTLTRPPDPTATSSATATEAATHTPLPSGTPELSLTAEPSATETATATATSTATFTATSTATEIPSSTASATTTPSETAGATPPPTPQVPPSPSSTATVQLAPVAGLLSATPAALPPTAIFTDTAAPTNAPEPTATLLPSDTPTPSPTASLTPSPSLEPPTPMPSATPVSTATVPLIAVAVLPSATPTEPPAASATATLEVAPTASSELASATPAAVAVAGAPDINGSGAAPGAADPVIAPLSEGDALLSLPRIVGGVALLSVLIYAALYAIQVANVARYREGFLLAVCPACEHGALYVEDRRYRVLGLPRVRRTVRCDECRSVLRQVGRRRWRYAVDGVANPELYAVVNNRVLTEHQLLEFAPEYRGAAPEFVDGDESTW